MFRITTHEDNRTVCLRLEGKLKGPWVLEMEQCWRMASSARDKALVVDLTDVDHVDSAGRYLLALIHARGASFIAATPIMKELVSDITGEVRLGNPGTIT
jgi:ABC-type transporter Mla MlaB component